MTHTLKARMSAHTLLTALVCASHCLEPLANAQSVPTLINYQGQLQDSTGSPLPTSDYSLSFTIWDSPVNGSKVWGPQVFDGQTGKQGHGGKVPVVRGYFNVILGPNDETDQSIVNAFEGTNRFVQIEVAGQGIITPRQQILSAPYALKAANSDKLGGFDWSALFGVNNPVEGKIAGGKLAAASVSGTTIASKAIDQSHLGNGSVGSNQLSDGSVLTRHLADASVTVAKLSPRAVEGNTASSGGIAIGATVTLASVTTDQVATLDTSVTIKNTSRAILLAIASEPGQGAKLSMVHNQSDFNAQYAALVIERSEAASPGDWTRVAEHYWGTAFRLSGSTTLDDFMQAFDCTSITIDVPPKKGTYTYRLKMYSSRAPRVVVELVRLIALEL